MAERKRSRPRDEPSSRREPDSESETDLDGDEEPLRVETQVRALAILEEVLKLTPVEDPRYDLLELLRHQLEVDEKHLQEAQAAIAQFNEVYEKLTAPANRIATFLGSPEEGIAYVSVGEAEYYTNVDPNLDVTRLKVGTRVKVNEAFVVLDDLDYHPEGPIVKVAEVLPDGRLRVSLDGQGLSSRIVMRSAELERAPLKPGDEVRMEPSMRVALEHFQKPEVKDYYLEEIPQTPWSAVGGQEEAIRLIRETIERPLLYPELYERFGKRPLKGILLYGPPGCGKTLIGKATAYNLTKTYSEHLGEEVKNYFMLINGPKLLNMWLGETERMVREIFAQARERAQEGYLVFIFIDEADSLLRTRSSGRYLNIANTVVPQFAAEMDGLVSLKNVVVMLTSNRPDYIDPAILRPERIDRKVKIARPNRQATRDIFSIYLDESVPLDPDWVERHASVEEARAALVERATDYLFRREPETAFLEVSLRSGRRETLYWKDLTSGALIMSAVERAKDLAIRRAIEEGAEEPGICWEDLKEAIHREYAENEIFPKSDSLEDWLKLLDYEPENVVEVRPARARRRRSADAVV